MRQLIVLIVVVLIIYLQGMFECWDNDGSTVILLCQFRVIFPILKFNLWVWSLVLRFRSLQELIIAWIMCFVYSSLLSSWFVEKSILVSPASYYLGVKTKVRKFCFSFTLCYYTAPLAAVSCSCPRRYSRDLHDNLVLFISLIVDDHDPLRNYCSPSFLFQSAYTITRLSRSPLTASLYENNGPSLMCWFLPET